MSECKQEIKTISDIDQLEKLLKDLIYRAGKGLLKDVESAVQQTGELVDKITGQTTLDQSNLRYQHENIAELYRRLLITLTADQANTRQRLKKISEHKKVLTKYHIGAV